MAAERITMVVRLDFIKQYDILICFTPTGFGSAIQSVYARYKIPRQPTEHSDVGMEGYNDVVGGGGGFNEHLQ